MLISFKLSRRLNELREYFAIAYASTSGSAPWMAYTSVVFASATGNSDMPKAYRAGIQPHVPHPDPAPLHTAHRPWPIPTRPWRLRQRWSKLLFAHWPIPAADIQRQLPTGLRVDTLDGWAWLGVVPFLMDQVRFRTLGEHSFGVPTATSFPELNLRTYVRAPNGRAGVYFFSLDASSPLAVLGARIAFGLPYFWSRMSMAQQGRELHYTSHRRHGPPAEFNARYRSLNTPSPQDSLTHFLTARYAFFIRRFGHIQAGEIHHNPWQLENAEADFTTNDLPGSFGFTLPNRPPLLHYAPELHMQAWTVRRLSRHG